MENISKKLLFVIGFFIGLYFIFNTLTIKQNIKEKYTFSEPYHVYDKIPKWQYARKHIYSNYLDPYSNFRHHKYPFAGYSLYGLDDNYYGSKYHPSKPNQKWEDIAQYRHTSGHNKGSPDYIGLPSYYFRRAYGWPNKNIK